MGIQCGSFRPFYNIFAKWETEKLTVWSICHRLAGGRRGHSVGFGYADIGGRGQGIRIRRAVVARRWIGGCAADGRGVAQRPGGSWCNRTRGRICHRSASRQVHRVANIAAA